MIETADLLDDIVSSSHSVDGFLRDVYYTLPLTQIGTRSSFVCFFFQILEGHKVRDAYTSPLPYTYIQSEDLPASFNWGDIDGVSYLTHSLNQHIPQYCGSCWAHGALSALSDRIKIAREGFGDEINLSIQYILNCAGDVAGSCHGGSHTGVYEFAQKSGFIPYDS
jgi:cathepsin X